MIHAKDPHAITLEHFPQTTPKPNGYVNGEVNGTHPLKQAHSHAQPTPFEIASTWLSKFSHVAASSDPSLLPTVLHDSAWWRDHLALSWDLRTLHPLENITTFLNKNPAALQLTNLTLTTTGKFAPSISRPAADQGHDLEWLESMFSFATPAGTGKGMLRLTQDTNGEWKGYMLYTALQELHSFPPAVGKLRPHGGDNSLSNDGKKGNWLEKRTVQQAWRDVQPDVVVIGAGQAGLNVAARLKDLGVSVLLVDKKKRVGDNWRGRYRTLVTHDPVQYTHMYGLPFPKNWPLFTPKDKLGDWFEAYVSLMELDVWCDSSIEKCEFDDGKKEWTIRVVKNGSEERTLKSKHVVFATGHAGEPKVPTFPGQDEFKGVVYHGSQHVDASEQGDVSGKKVLVVGTGNSGHDVAQNYYEAGAEVTMLQRSGTYVIQADKGLFMLHEGMYDEGSPPVEDSDIAGQSLPIRVQFKLNVGLTNKIKERERENLEGLEKAGFEVDFGEDGSGIYRKYVTRGGGYYIDVGASQLVREGKIKLVRSPEGIEGFTENQVTLKDGRSIDADVAVLATGYDNMRTTLEKVMGQRVADRAKDVWDIDEEGEVNAVSGLSCSRCLVLTSPRCGVHQVTQDFGSWEEVLHCAERIPGSWHCRSRVSKADCMMPRYCEFRCSVLDELSELLVCSCSC